MKKILSILIACFVFLIVSLLLLASCDDACRHPQLFETAIAPTCDQEGKTLHTCPDCGYEYATDVVAPKGHNLQETVTLPTCEDQGYTTYTCGDCGYSYVADHTPPLSHALLSTTVEATCAANGYTKHTCERCNYYYEDNLITLSHTFTATSVPVTCTHSGYTEYQCNNCEYHYRDYLHYTDLLPSAYTQNTAVLAKGLDVSKYNHKKDADGNYLPLDWVAIKNAGFDYVILKIGSTPRADGTVGGLEPTFETDYAAAKAAGLDVGIYFFTYATTVEQNVADADLVAEWLSGKALEYPVYYDIENHSFDDDPIDSINPVLPDRKTLTDFCVAFISRMQEKGFYCGLYCNRDWLENKLDTEKCLALFDIWYARFRDISNPYTPTDIFTWTYGEQLGMWQYASTGTIDGFPGVNFDFNYTYKDFPAIMEQFHLNGY